MTPRAAAISNGDKYYKSGKPCSAGHTADRFASTRSCVECMRVKSFTSMLAFRKRNPAAGPAAARKWRNRFPGKVNAISGRKRASRSQRTPTWGDKEKIDAMYAQARVMTEMLGEPWRVDHEIPLRGKLVSGLHVHANLRILPGVENMQKRNTFSVE